MFVYLLDGLETPAPKGSPFFIGNIEVGNAEVQHGGDTIKSEAVELVLLRSLLNAALRSLRCCPTTKNIPKESERGRIGVGVCVCGCRLRKHHRNVCHLRIFL